VLTHQKLRFGRDSFLSKKCKRMTRVKMNMVLMKDFANSLGILSVLAIGLLSSQAANAGFLINAQSWREGTTPPTGVIFVENNSALKAKDLAEITGTPADQLGLLLKQDAGSDSPDSSSILKSSLSLEFPRIPPAEFNTFTLANSESFPVMDLLSPLYLVVKDGNNQPAQYVIDLGIFKSGGSVWDGMASIMGSGFWAGEGVGGQISHVALWGSEASGDLDGDLGGNAVVPEPATVALFAFGLFCFACGPIRRRLQKGTVVGVAG
jgi:hypothetical protein